MEIMTPNTLADRFGDLGIGETLVYFKTTRFAGSSPDRKTLAYCCVGRDLEQEKSRAVRAAAYRYYEDGVGMLFQAHGILGIEYLLLKVAK